MLHIFWSIIVGFVVGWVARAIVPGADAMGFWLTAGLGIAGSIAGGLVARVFSRPSAGAKFHPAGCLMSILGAAALLWVWKLMH
jgi:uncharacterized membrane protein YeaQ/YmgE (transglycosylase-associated protein family)